MSEGEAVGFEGLLSNYLLGGQPGCDQPGRDRPGCIVLIGSQQIDIHWSDVSQLPPILRFATLSDYSDTDVVAPAVAIVRLDDQTGSPDQLLGHAVRLFPQRLIVCTDGVALADHRFYAFGFRRLDVVNAAASGTNARWFEYQLSTYKSSPDWLNARFWANPERFESDDESDAYTYDEEE